MAPGRDGPGRQPALPPKHTCEDQSGTVLPEKDLGRAN